MPRNLLLVEKAQFHKYFSFVLGFIESSTADQFAKLVRVLHHHSDFPLCPGDLAGLQMLFIRGSFFGMVLESLHY